MPHLLVHGFTISLGGYGAGPDQTLEAPMGKRPRPIRLLRTHYYGPKRLLGRRLVCRI